MIELNRKTYKGAVAREIELQINDERTNEIGGFIVTKPTVKITSSHYRPERIKDELRYSFNLYGFVKVDGQWTEVEK